MATLMTKAQVEEYISKMRDEVLDTRKELQVEKNKNVVLEKEKIALLKIIEEG